MKRTVVRVLVLTAVVAGSLVIVPAVSGVAGAAVGPGALQVTGHRLVLPTWFPTDRQPRAASDRPSIIGPRTVVSGTWATVPSPSAESSSQLLDVSCASVAFCVAVGQTATGVEIEQWNGVHWRSAIGAAISASDAAILEGVSCPTTSFCMAVGAVEAIDGDSPAQSLTEIWNGTDWSIAASPNPITADDTELVSVDCTGPFFCMSVGAVTDITDTTVAPVAIEWNGATWNDAAAVDPPNESVALLLSVSCAGSSWCTAVGTTTVAPVAEQWSPAGWEVVATMPVPAGNDGELDAVSCTSSTMCMAVGLYVPASNGTSFNTESMIEQWNGANWTESPFSTVDGQALAGVSCAGPTSCSAVGTDRVSNLVFAPMAVSWNGTTWSSNYGADPTTQANEQAYFNSVDCIGGRMCTAVGAYSPNSDFNEHNLIESAPLDRPGYRSATADGGVFAFGGAPVFGSAAGIRLLAPVVGMASTPDGGGYWLVASDGGVFAYGDASFYGSAAGIHLQAPIVGIASTPDGGGYWLVAADGGVFAYGDASFYGSTGDLVLAKPMVGMAPTADGAGYWLVAADGGVFAYGDARYDGSTGAKRITAPMVGMASTPDGAGYWLVAADGGVFAYGDATFYGSTGDVQLNAPAVGMAPTADGSGYWLVASDGGVFAFGDAGFDGSTAGEPLEAPMVGTAS